LERSSGRVDLARIERLTRSLSMLRREHIRSRNGDVSKRALSLADLAETSELAETSS